MADTGAKNAGTVSDNSGTGSQSWTNPTNAQGASNTVYTTVAVPSVASSHWLWAVGFGLSVTAGATINGVYARYYRFYAGMGMGTDVCKLIIAGAVAGNSKSTAWSSGVRWDAFGSSSDLWGATPTAAQANDNSNFGVAISVRGVNPSIATTAYIDAVEMTVYFTPAGSSIMMATSGVVMVPHGIA